MSLSFNAFSAPLSGGRKPWTWAGVAMWDRSVATCASARGPLACGLAHSDSVDDIVERELGDQGVELEEEGKRLTDSTCVV